MAARKRSRLLSCGVNSSWTSGHATLRSRALPAVELARSAVRRRLVCALSFLPELPPSPSRSDGRIHSHEEIRSVRLVRQRRAIPNMDGARTQLDSVSEQRGRLVEIDLAADSSLLAQAL